ncbi:MAG: glycosyltransferase [Terracidiphilus sp.]|nr:glycosyltransferase [Terracidiphilus sp.]
MENEEFDIELPSKVPGDIWVTYAGTLGSNYDIPALCAATKEPVLRDCGRNIRIMIAGDGPMREQLVSRINCGELTNMTYLGALSLAQVARLYAKSDIGLSIYSPGSSVVIPAKAYDMYAAALPFVNSAHGEFMEFIVAQKLGLAYQAGDPKSLSCSIAKLAVDDELRSECRRNLQRIAPAFDRKAQYSQVAEILRSIAPDAL